MSIPIEEHGAPSTVIHLDVPDTAPEESSGLSSAFSMKNVSKKFVWGLIVARLLVVPGLTFAFLVFLAKSMPFLFGGKGTEDRTLLLVLFSQVAAPTAINSALLYNSADFMTYPWAKMLFFQYLLCTLSTVLWTSLGLSFVESL
ncbi:hypothetical protein AGDE_17143 [Angomonas deanei]|uniref:Membrane transport protein n=1 Tax=Angomonas deanei TaxID=59799 RepID=A0A7G2C454_9TRYP|nr:hypothetical protein AGDE_17143 [Angomonas deanei]CAD2213961.1 hypothetical protein, conserved [Angomonas deanei]|eukprot:EPY15375.1 hypothetical protein AGDE_17143 [Angomonas deanei]